jgi:hypothetical protein
MTATDTDDLLMAALEPDEKIVWSDRPHRISSSALHMLWRRLTKVSTLVALGFVVGVVLVFVGVKEAAETGAARAVHWETLGVPLILGLASLPILLETFWFLNRVAHTASHRYAITDRARGIFVMPDTVGTFPLPEPGAITTRASGAAEHGDIDLGVCAVTERTTGAPRRRPRQVVFRAVSYPLVAVETIRAVAGGPGGSRKPPLLT